MGQRTHAIALLWDRPALLATMGALVGLGLTLHLRTSAAQGLAFGLLYLPALLGNLVSLPLCWRRDTRTGRPIKWLIPSLVVGAIGWSFHVPLASWLAAPLLELQGDFHPLREGLVLLLYLVLGEAWFYGVHRLLHAHKALFRLLHAHHHRITDPHVANASYQHPIELVVITMGTAWVGPLLVPGHATTVALWCALVMLLGNYGHSGAPSIHDEHHRTSRGNFGFVFLDAVLHTTRADVLRGRASARVSLRG